jgi:hypothetical protein
VSAGRATVRGEHPLAARLASLDRDDGWIEACLDPVPPSGDGWLSSASIARDPEALERLYAVARASTGDADDRTIGAMMTQRVAEPGRLAGILYRRDRRVPMLPPETPVRPYTEAEHSSIRLLDDAFACLADDPVAGHPAARPVATLDELRAVLVREVRRNVEPAIEPIAARSRLAPRAVWSLTAYGALVSITETMADDGDPDGAVAELRALMAIAGPLGDPAADARVVPTEWGPRFVLRMGACCRIYRWPGGRTKCVACPVRTPEERRALQAVEHVDD